MTNHGDISNIILSNTLLTGVSLVSLKSEPRGLTLEFEDNYVDRAKAIFEKRIYIGRKMMGVRTNVHHHRGSCRRLVPSSRQL